MGPLKLTFKNTTLKSNASSDHITQTFLTIQSRWKTLKEVSVFYSEHVGQPSMWKEPMRLLKIIYSVRGFNMPGACRL